MMPDLILNQKVKVFLATSLHSKKKRVYFVDGMVESFNELGLSLQLSTKGKKAKGLIQIPRSNISAIYFENNNAELLEVLREKNDYVG